MQTGATGLLLSLLMLLPPPFSIEAQSLRPEDPAPNILVLNSNHVGYFWTDMVVQGIRSTLNEIPMAQVHIEFMDSRRHSDRQDLERLCEYYRHKYRNLKFDVIISSVDAALEFLMENHEGLFPK